MLEAGFLITAFGVLILFFRGIGRNRKVLMYKIIWIFIILLTSWNGYFLANPNHFAGIMVATVGINIFIFKEVDVGKVNKDYLVGVHVLRILIEFILFQLYKQGEVPKLMTFLGWNFDILIGFSAIIILLFSRIIQTRNSEKIFLYWNVAGLMLLGSIVMMAVLSSPMAYQQWGFEQPNIAVLRFPFILLPSMIVPIVCLSHLLLIKDIEQEF